jgi:hypothetical protein
MFFLLRLPPSEIINVSPPELYGAQYVDISLNLFDTIRGISFNGNEELCSIWPIICGTIVFRLLSLRRLPPRDPISPISKMMGYFSLLT